MLRLVPFRLRLFVCGGNRRTITRRVCKIPNDAQLLICLLPTSIGSLRVAQGPDCGIALRVRMLELATVAFAGSEELFRRREHRMRMGLRFAISSARMKPQADCVGLT